MAGGPAGRLHGQHHHHHPRPLVSGQRGHPHRRVGSRQAVVLPRQLRGLLAAKRRAAGARGGHQRPRRQALGARGGVDPQGRGSPPHPGDCAHRAPGQFTRLPRGTPRSGWQRQYGCQQRRNQRQTGRRVDARVQEFWRPQNRARLLGNDFARRQDRPARPQRRGQNHAAQTDPGRAQIRPGTSQCPRARTRPQPLGHGAPGREYCRRVFRPDAQRARYGRHAGRLHQPGQRVDRNRQPPPARQKLFGRLFVLTRAGQFPRAFFERWRAQPAAAGALVCASG